MYYHNFLVILATFNEYHWSFFTSGAQISYKTNTVGRSVEGQLQLKNVKQQFLGVLLSSLHAR